MARNEKIKGAILEDLSSYLFPILGFHDYRITNNGNVYKIIELGDRTHERPNEVRYVDKYECNNIIYCQMISDKGNEVEVPVAKLLLCARYGDLNLPIKFKDGDYTNIKIDNVVYNFCDSDVKFDPTDNNILYIKYKDNEFRQDPQIPTYYTTNDGTIFNAKKRCLMKKYLNYSSASDSYYKIYTLYRDPITTEIKSKNSLVHQMVYRAWIGPYDNSLMIDHKNMHKYDNRIKNLELVTHFENVRRAHDVGMTIDNYKGSSKYRTRDIKILCRMIEKGSSIDECYNFMINAGYKFNSKDTCVNLIYDIRRGRAFRDISSNFDLKKNDSVRKSNINKLYLERAIQNPEKYVYPNRKINKEGFIKEMHKFLDGYQTIEGVANGSGVSIKIIRLILKGKETYRDIYQDDDRIKNYIDNVYPAKPKRYIRKTV